MRFPSDIEALAHQIVQTYATHKKKIVTAESCTGGLIAAALTSIAGSSEAFERGFVSYSYDSKTDLLGVLPEDLVRFGAVSPEIAESMAKGALEYSLADVALSVTGIAGPDGATPEKPVGLVYFGIATKEGAIFHLQCGYRGDRHDVRRQCVVEALKLLLSLIKAEWILASPAASTKRRSDA